ncbi:MULTISPECIES: hypothetical protein [unclassified Streptomyces]|uniref:hypothetical protein n=1 Tax=unclassified Streptomyces TaxID=2593676 RepID=UPI0033B435A1
MAPAPRRTAVAGLALMRCRIADRPGRLSARRLGNEEGICSADAHRSRAVRAGQQVHEGGQQHHENRPGAFHGAAAATS